MRTDVNILKNDYKDLWTDYMGLKSNVKELMKLNASLSLRTLLE